MNITDIRIRKSSFEGKMKAMVSITIDDTLVVHDMRVIDGQNGLFVAMPSRKGSDGEYKDIVHPINTESRQMIQQTILDKYAQMLAEEQPAEAE